MTFYDIFESLCTQKGVTPTQAGRENGIAQGVVSMWKKRGSTPQAPTVKKLAKYFGVSTDDLLVKEEHSLGIWVGGKIIAPKGFKSKYGVWAGQGIEADGPVEIGLVVQGEQARANKAMEQMTEEGKRKVADYAEDILPQYQATQPPSAPQSPASNTDAPGPQNAAENGSEPEKDK